jgi:hypothetical protein
MPKIIDERVLQGKRNRDENIRNEFNKLWDTGLRYEIIEEKIILKYGVSVSAINKIMKAANKQTN